MLKKLKKKFSKHKENNQEKGKWGLLHKKAFLNLEMDSFTVLQKLPIEIINNKARHNLLDAKCRWRSD